MPTRYVKRYVRRNKTEAADAAAICETAGRPSMRFVPVKSASQQGVLALHGARDLLVRQRTMMANALRAHLAEFDIVAGQGHRGLGRLIALLPDPAGEPARCDLPEEARAASGSDRLLAGAGNPDRRARASDRALASCERDQPTAGDDPGYRPDHRLGAGGQRGRSRAFATGRHFAAWLGLTPREWLSAMKRRQGAISKRGDGYLRRLLILGSHAVMRERGRTGAPRASEGRESRSWLAALRARRPRSVPAVAMVNKTARIAWVLMVHGGTYYQGRPAL